MWQHCKVCKEFRKEMLLSSPATPMQAMAVAVYSIGTKEVRLETMAAPSSYRPAAVQAAGSVSSLAPSMCDGLGLAWGEPMINLLSRRPSRLLSTMGFPGFQNNQHSQPEALSISLPVTTT